MNETPVNDATDVADHDEYTGIGGRYVRDPVTGKRTPAPADHEPAQQAEIQE